MTLCTIILHVNEKLLSLTLFRLGQGDGLADNTLFSGTAPRPHPPVVLELITPTLITGQLESRELWFQQNPLCFYLEAYN